MIVKKCNDCPFLVRDYNGDSNGYDTLLYCNLSRTKGISNCIQVYNSSDNTPRINIPDFCPLHTEKIVVELFG